MDPNQVTAEAVDQRTIHNENLGATPNLDTTSSLATGPYRPLGHVIDDEGHPRICLDVPVLLAPGEIRASELDDPRPLVYLERHRLCVRLSTRTDSPEATERMPDQIGKLRIREDHTPSPTHHQTRKP
jgi:hypothetical protein